jgi:hypothetical protein
MEEMRCRSEEGGSEGVRAHLSRTASRSALACRPASARSARIFCARTSAVCPKGRCSVMRLRQCRSTREIRNGTKTSVARSGGSPRGCNTHLLEHPFSDEPVSAAPRASESWEGFDGDGVRCGREDSFARRGGG